ncbi:MAG TPA: hypothetical protein VFA83_13335 [Acidimicrobiales bacterium]|nr:hypothetical protein [Acidimicrobiales bacterium]
MATVPVRHAARDAGIDLRELYRLIDSGELAAQRDGDEIVVDPEDVARVTHRPTPQ